MQNSATPLSIAAGQSLTLNGQGLVVEGSTMLLAGNLSATDEIIGDIGTGAVFTQTGGTNTASGALTLANNPGSSGTYNLQGGSLSADTFNLNTGGTFNQSGGTFHFNTSTITAVFSTLRFLPGPHAGSSSSYNLRAAP